MKKGYPFISLTAIMIVWSILTYSGFVNPLLLAKPHLVLIKLYEVFSTGDIFPDIFATLWRMLTGLTLAIILGVPAGLWVGYSKRINDLMDPIIDTLRSVPATALFPLFMIVFGIGNEAKIAVVAWGCGFVILINTIYGVRHGKKIRILVAKTMNASKLDIFRKVIFPDALPYIFSGLKVAVSYSFLITVVIEMFIGTTFGLGRRISDAQMFYDIPEIYSSLIIVGCTGYILNKVFNVIESKVIHWKGV